MSVETGKGLTDSQRRAVESPENEVVVTAAAGSGKTRVMVERFLHLVRSRSMDPGRIVAITYGEKAANELKRRLRGALGADFPDSGNITTIHGFCRKLLLEYPIEAGVDPSLSVMDEDLAGLLKRETAEDLLESAFHNPDFRVLFDAFSPDRLQASLFAAHGTWRSSDREPRAVEGDQGEELSRAFTGLLKDFDAEYARRKAERVLADFDDLIHLALRLTKNPDWRARIASDYDAVMVDEYQDVNALQALLVARLAEGRELFIVGDARQSIYGFRHAECRHLVERAEAARGGRGALAELPENHRSRPSLVAFVNAVFEGLTAASGSGFGRMFATREEDGSRRVEFHVERGGEDGVDECRTREAARIAGRIDALHAEGRSYGDMAVLFRKMTGVELYEAEFKRAGIPFHFVRGRGFYDQTEITDMMRALRAVLDPSDDLALMSCAKSPMGGLSDDALYLLRKTRRSGFYESLRAGGRAGSPLEPRDAEKCRRFLSWYDELRTKRHHLSAGDMIERVLAATDYDCRVLAGPGAERRWLNLVKLKEKAAAFGRFSQGDIERFTRFVCELTDRQVREAEASVETESGAAVKILTVHQAKGLEFPVVFVAGMGDDKRPPSQSAFMVTESLGILTAVPQRAGEAVKGERYLEACEVRKRAELEESRRLLYVALTRATELLVLSGTVHPKARSSWMDCVAEAAPQIREEGVSGDIVAGGVPALLMPIMPGERVPPAAETPQAAVEAGRNGERARAVLERLKPFRLDYRETVNFTVSALVEFRKDPGAVLSSRPEPEWEEEGIGAAEYGNLYHYAMQHLDFTKPAEEGVRKLLKAWTRPVDEETAAAVVRAAEVFLESAAGAEIRAAATAGHARGVYRELPFLFRITEGETDLGFLIGQADLLYRSNEGWTVVDYKTGAARADEHAFQVRAYAHCLQALLGEPVRRSILYYTETGESVDAGPAPDAQEFGRELVRLFGGMRARINVA